MLERTQDPATEDEAFQNKWVTYSFSPVSEAAQYSVWKKFLREAPKRLNEDNYQEIPTKLWDEDFQIPALESSAHDKTSFSREMDTRQEIAHTNHELGDEPAKPAKLSPAALRSELSIWTPRNLTIFFIEYLIDSEIEIQTMAEKSHRSPTKMLDERIKKIEATFSHILQAVNAADYYASEPEHYDPLFNTHPKLYNVAHESAVFANQLEHVAMLLSAKQFELLKLRTTIIRSGILLPKLDDIIKIGSMKDDACQAEIDATIERNLHPSLRRSQRIHTNLCDHGDNTGEPEKSPAQTEAVTAPGSPSQDDSNQNPSSPHVPNLALTRLKPLPQHARERQKSSLKQFLVAAGIVLGIVLMVTGAVLATVFTGGTAPLALAVGVAAVLASCAAVGGIMTVYHNAAHKKAERREKQAEQHIENTKIQRTINADLHQHFGLTPANKSELRDMPLTDDSDNTHGAASIAAYQPLPAATSQPLWALPPVQNQETTIALTQSANLR